MKLAPSVAWLSLAATAAPRAADAFVATTTTGARPPPPAVGRSPLLLAAATTEEDCGCASPSPPPTTYAGKPSDAARARGDPRDALRGSAVLDLRGERASVDDVLRRSSTSLVVFLRSLG